LVISFSKKMRLSTVEARGAGTLRAESLIDGSRDRLATGGKISLKLALVKLKAKCYAEFMAKRKQTSEATAQTRERTKIKPVSFSLKPDEIALLDEAAAKHGGRKAALLVGLRAAVGQNELSRDALLAEIGRRLK
jgi:hypothetical protein